MPGNTTKYMKISMLLIIVAVFSSPVYSIISEPDSDMDGIPDNYEKDKQCNKNCPSGFHCEKSTEGTIIYKTNAKYKPMFDRGSADSICANEKPDNLGCENVHAMLSFADRNKGESDFAVYMPKYNYTSDKPLYWYNRNTGNLVQFATSFQDAFYGQIEVSNKQGTGDDEYYWTGSTKSGKFIWNNNYNGTCDNFNTESGNFSGMAGDPESTYSWFSGEEVPCNETHNILCACQPDSEETCVSDCTPTKTECDANDCGVQLDGCGGTLMCDTGCSEGYRCRGEMVNEWQMYEYNKQCTSCIKCNPGEVEANVSGYFPGTGYSRHVDWKCESDGDCTHFVFNGYNQETLEGECYADDCQSDEFTCANENDFSFSTFKSKCEVCDFPDYTFRKCVDNELEAVSELNDCQCLVNAGYQGLEPHTFHKYQLTYEGCFVDNELERSCCAPYSGCEDFACVSRAVDIIGGGRECPEELDPLHDVPNHDSGTI